MKETQQQRSWWTVIGAVLGGVAVITGAFGAHGLEGVLQDIYGDATKLVEGEEIPAWAKYLRDFRTAAEYQFYHALALLAVGLLSGAGCRISRAVAGWSFSLGVLLFSGSLYALVLTGETRLGMITPIGGVLFIVGWIALAAAACPCRATRKGARC